MATATRVTPYGLKEVADVYFFPTDAVITYVTSGGSYGNGFISTTATPKFIFDTLKVSNIEISAEEASATGGKGNAELINWSYGKEITLTMEDAVFNLSTIDLLFGSKTSTDDSSADSVVITPETADGFYKIVGQTYIRDKEMGTDIGFIFEIGKGKVNLGGTLTMEADGDPSTFEMTVKALKDKNGNLITFKRVGSASSNSALDSNITTT